MSVSISIKVTPSSGKQKIELDKSGQIKCFVKSPPENGKANTELVKFLSKSLAIPQDEIVIIQGATSRKKVVKILATLSQEQILQKLGLAHQNSLIS